MTGVTITIYHCTRIEPAAASMQGKVIMLNNSQEIVQEALLWLLQEGMLFDLIGIQFYNNNPCDGTPAKVDASYQSNWAPL